MDAPVRAVLPAAAADQSYADALDDERGDARIDDDRLERTVFRRQHDIAPAPAETLDGHLVAARGADACNDDRVYRGPVGSSSKNAYGSVPATVIFAVASGSELANS